MDVTKLNAHQFVVDSRRLVRLRIAALEATDKLLAAGARLRRWDKTLEPMLEELHQREREVVQAEKKFERDWGDDEKQPVKARRKRV